MAMSKTLNDRMDAVFIRKSSSDQDENGQIANVESLLEQIGVNVPKSNWYLGTVSRRRVKANAEFNSLLQLVENDKLRTVYIESQDRWGTKDRVELFGLLGTLREHNTRLLDLREKKDLTEKNFTTEMLAILNSFKSEKELEDISYRSLRTRVNNFKERRSWPTGPHPFGYGKACYAPDGKLLWAWQPVSRTHGQVFNPNADGELTPGVENVKIPRKAREDRIFLVSSNNGEFVESVRLVFDLYTRIGLSRRKISAHLNQQGRKFYNRQFSHSYVTQILENPVYVGDTHFGKTKSGEMHSFDSKGQVVPVEDATGKVVRRSIEQRLVEQDTHEALIDRDTWNLAEAKRSDERRRTSHAPRNPNYFLKQIFVCGHCGQNLVGRTETHPTTGEKKFIYLCSTYAKGRCGGHDVSCGYQRITHEDALRLLLEKIDELDLEYDEAASNGVRASLENRHAELEDECDEHRWQILELMQEGIEALLNFFRSSYELDAEELSTIEMIVKGFYRWGRLSLPRRPKGLPIDLTIAMVDLKKAIKDVERSAVAQSEQKVAELTKEHEQFTVAWAKATEMQQAVLQKKIDQLESDIRLWKPRTLSVSQRLNDLHEAADALRAERRQLVDDWPSLENREKGEALRRLFKKVTLHWSRKWCPASKSPSRPRKTNRKGRNSYTLERDRIGWEIANVNLTGSS